MCPDLLLAPTPAHTHTDAHTKRHTSVAVFASLRSSFFRRKKRIVSTSAERELIFSLSLPSFHAGLSFSCTPSLYALFLSGSPLPSSSAFSVSHYFTLLLHATMAVMWVCDENRFYLSSLPASLSPHTFSRVSLCLSRWYTDTRSPSMHAQSSLHSVTSARHAMLCYALLMLCVAFEARCCISISISRSIHCIRCKKQAMKGERRERAKAAAA